MKEVKPICVIENIEYNCRYNVFKDWGHYESYKRYLGIKDENIIKGPFFSN